MTIIEKIKQSVEGSTGMPFLYHAAGELNELIARCGELPVAYSFLIDSGTIDDVNGIYHERVTLAVMFCDKTEFDFNAVDNEEIIDRMKIKAYKWLQSLRMSNTLRIVSINSTQRLYDNTTDVLTGFAVNITIDDLAGVGECELPEVVIDVDKNGSYDVVGVDKVRVNIVPRLEELEVTQNGEYLPPTDIAGFSKVSVNVQPVLEELTITANGEYTPQDGVDGFSKVVAEFDTSSLPKVKVAALKINDACLNEDGIWEGSSVIDFSECTELKDFCSYVENIRVLDVSNWDTSKVVSFESFTRHNRKLKEIVGIEDMDVGSCRSFASFGLYCLFETQKDIDLRKWNTSNVIDFSRFLSQAGINRINMEGCDTKKVTDFRYFLHGGNTNSIRWINIVGISAESVTRSMDYCLCLMNDAPNLSIVGDYSVAEVIERNLCVFSGLRFSYKPYGVDFTRASLRAIINGLADLTGETTQTFAIGAKLMAKLTEEDIAIATNKNWTIA